jgi:hypothetical protein
LVVDLNREEYFFDLSRLPKAEQEYYEKITPIIEGLLIDLKKRNCLRIPSREETAQLLKVLKDKDEMSLSLNMIYRLFSQERLADFLEKTKGYFADASMSYMLMSQLYLHFLTDVELFRVIFLFYLKRGKEEIFNDNMTLNPFLTRLKKVSPRYAKLIEEELDVRLRNSLAHGIYRIEGATFFFYEHIGKLNNPTPLALDVLLTKWKKQHLMYHCLLQVIAERLRNRELC